MELNEIKEMIFGSPRVKVTLEWIPVLERVPNTWLGVLVVDHNNHIESCWLNDDGEWERDGEKGVMKNVTHWADYPEGPNNRK